MRIISVSVVSVPLSRAHPLTIIVPLPSAVIEKKEGIKGSAIREGERTLKSFMHAFLVSTTLSYGAHFMRILLELLQYV